MTTTNSPEFNRTLILALGKVINEVREELQILYPEISKLELFITQHCLIPVVDEEGKEILDLNRYGEYCIIAGSYVTSDNILNRIETNQFKVGEISKDLIKGTVHGYFKCLSNMNLV